MKQYKLPFHKKELAFVKTHLPQVFYEHRCYKHFLQFQQELHSLGFQLARMRNEPMFHQGLILVSSSLQILDALVTTLYHLQEAILRSLHLELNKVINIVGLSLPFEPK